MNHLKPRLNVSLWLPLSAVCVCMNVLQCVCAKEQVVNNKISSSLSMNESLAPFPRACLCVFTLCRKILLNSLPIMSLATFFNNRAPKCLCVCVCVCSVYL